MNAPTIHTHVAATADLPEEAKETDIDRPDIEVPSLWRRSVVAVHRHSKRRAIVHKVAHDTNQWRPFYPDELDPKTGTMGRFAGRTEWLSFDPKGIAGDWEPEVTLSPTEVQRLAIQSELEAAVARLDIREAALVNVLCDDEEPAKNWAKLQALISAGLIKGPLEAHAASLDGVGAAARGADMAAARGALLDVPADKVDRRTKAYRDRGEP